jgi:hypothetical protein
MTVDQFTAILPTLSDDQFDEVWQSFDRVRDAERTVSLLKIEALGLLTLLNEREARR